MKLCLVTDRRRLGESVGARAHEWTDALREQVHAASQAGVDYVQVREADLETGDLADLVRLLLAAIDGSQSKLLVNDRIDVALACRAHGVHLKEQSIAPEIARRIAPAPFVISCAVHTTAAIDARKAADFLIAGTVLSTASKRAPEYLNEDGLRRIVRAAAEQPVFGIGGLDVSSIPLLRASGAAGLAAIGAFIPVGRTSIFEFVQKRVQQLRFALDQSAHGT